jgi:hypothetical protein
LIEFFWGFATTAAAAVAMLLIAKTFARRWRRRMNVIDADYAATLATLSESSVRRSFQPYTDIAWDATEYSVAADDRRWILAATDPVGRHRWYRAQPPEKQIAMGMWRQANAAKVCLHLESILIRGLVQYTFWLPNGSPEFRYCLHETIEECNHSLMFQELVNRVGVNVPGVPRVLRWISPLLPLAAGVLSNAFFFGVLAGEIPIDQRHLTAMRDRASLPPIVEKVTAIHVAEEARHISFADRYLRQRVPQMQPTTRFMLSLYVPIIMRAFCVADVPPREFFKEFEMPRRLRSEVFNSPEFRQARRDMFGDVRRLCHDMQLMNPLARLVWRICGIDGAPSRYRNEPRREHLPVATTV